MSSGEYDWTMEPGQYAQGFQNVNPYSSQIMNQLIPHLQGIMGGMGAGAPQSGDFMKSFMASVPGLRGITTEATSGLAREQQESLKGMTGQTISQVGGELSKLGSVYSSAFPRLVGEAMAPEISQLQTQLSSQRLGLFGGLAQTAMPLFAQGAQLPYQYGMQAAGLLGGLGQPDMAAPDVAYHKSPWEQYWMPLLESLMGAGATLGAGAIGG